ncbi:MAG: hypothetical protein ABJE47_08460 [bacterium]
MRTRPFVRLAAFAAAALLAACSSDSIGAPTTPPSTTTLSQVLSEMSTPPVSGASSVGVVTPVPLASVPVPSACSYSAASQSFSCPTVVAGGLTITQSFTLLDASGKPQSQFDAGSTAAVRVKSSLAGTVSASGSTLTIDEQQDLTMSGLLTPTHVLNGTMAMRMNGTIVSGSLSSPIASNMTMTMSNLVSPAGMSSANPWPASGTITEDATTSVDNLPAITTHMTMTFNGTSTVAIVVTIGATTQHCTVNLSSGVSGCF